MNSKCRDRRHNTGGVKSSSREDMLEGDVTYSASPSRVEFSEVVTENFYDDVIPENENHEEIRT